VLAIVDDNYQGVYGFMLIARHKNTW
jgi:hypothetical protein